jgi:hypothetical protein
MKMMIRKILVSISIVATLLACEKKYDAPQITLPEEGEVITLDTLLSWYQGYPIKFTENYSLYTNVTMDEEDGNLYKSVYVQSGDKGINVRLLSGGGLYKGDSIRIDLKGLILNRYNGMMQLDSVDVDKNIVKVDVNREVPPLVTTLDQINPNLQSRLVKFENVQFIGPDISKTYADKANLESGDVYLEDANGNTALVRSSGYARFADEPVAQGSGSIVCIVSVFNNTVQLLIRSFDEINMNGPRFPGIQLLKNFDDGMVTSGGWAQHPVIGSNILWETSSAGGASSDYCQISNYLDGTKYNSENWLVSPSMDLSTLGSPYLNFNNAYNYTGPALQVLVSNDYDGVSNPNSATWTVLSPILSGGSWAWANSGNVDLTPYKASNVHVAFKYTGTTADGSTWEIDDVKVIG